jgi:hypothetical protein
VGLLMSVTTLFFMLFAGFFVVKNTLERDRQTRVGQIIASTPIPQSLYVLGKVLSNLTVFVVMMVILILAAIAAQFVQGEEARVMFWPLLSPFLLVWLPPMATVAALAVLFETLPGLRGGWGNVAYLFLLITFISYHLTLISEHATNVIFVDLTGYGLIESVFSETLGDRIPGYDGHFQITATRDPALLPILWEGIPWTAERLAARLYWLGVALGLVLVAAVSFNRFDPARGSLQRFHLSVVLVWRGRVGRWRGCLHATTVSIASRAAGRLGAALERVGLTSAGERLACPRFGRMLLAELRLMLKGHRWWWHLVALWLIIRGLIGVEVRHEVLPYTWLWPLLIWSAMGVREIRHGTEQLVFSSPHPLGLQLPATWVAGVIVAVLAGSGVLVRLVLEGDWAGIGAWMVGALFIPALALAMGCWSRNSRLFEVVYAILWYAGPVEGIAALDFMGASGGSLSCTCRSPGTTSLPDTRLIYLACTIVLLVLAFVGRKRQLTT